MADYLKTDFWNEWDISHRNFNLSAAGTHAKDGMISYNTDGYSGDLDGLMPARADLINEAFKLFKAVLGINFQATASESADIHFRDNESGAFTLASLDGSAIEVATINIASDWHQGGAAFNDYTFQTILHEIGHSLGLGHLGLYNESGSYSSDADFTNDSWQSSMMSYFSQSDNTSVEAGFAFLSTPMVVDWIALDQIYADQGYGITNAFQGDTTYGFNTTIPATTSRIFNQLAELIPSTAFTLVDGGGNDTLDFSRYSYNQLIDLRDSDVSASKVYASNIAGNTGNLTIAPGTIIETAIGGAGNDMFHGNIADNNFYGGDGIDTLLVDGSPDDYSLSRSGETLLLTDLRKNQTGGVDTLNDIEYVNFNGEIFSWSDLLNRLDSTSPTISISTDASSLNANQTASISFSLSEDSFDFTQSDVSLSGGSLSNWTAFSASSYTATYMPFAKKRKNRIMSESTISVQSGTFSDSAGNFNTDGSDRDNLISIQSKNDVPASFAIKGKALAGRKLKPKQMGKNTGGNGSFRHAWQISSNGSDWTTVKKGSVYKPTEKQAGKTVRLLTTYIDSQGFSQETQSDSRTISSDLRDITSASFRQETRKFKMNAERGRHRCRSSCPSMSSVGHIGLRAGQKIYPGEELLMTANDFESDLITGFAVSGSRHAMHNLTDIDMKACQTELLPLSPSFFACNAFQSTIKFGHCSQQSKPARNKNDGFRVITHESSFQPDFQPPRWNHEEDCTTNPDQGDLVNEMTIHHD